VQTVEVTREKKILEGDLPAQVNTLVQILLERGLFGKWGEEDRDSDGRQSARNPSGGKAVWVVAETLGNALRPVTLELLGKASELAAKYGGEVGALLMGSGVDQHVATLAIHGADVVYLAEDQRLAPYSMDIYTPLLAQAIQDHKPGAVLLGSTAIGRDLAPRVAARLGLGLTGDCVDLDRSESQLAAQFDPFQHFAQIVAPRDFEKAAAVEGIEMDVQPA